MDDYQILKFASLFHDIGKFYQRADNLSKGGHQYDDIYKDVNHGKSGAHSKWSADFLSGKFDDLVENLALYHHNPRESDYKVLAQMLQKADHHSSKERLENSEKNDVLITPLLSIFSRISLNSANVNEYYVPLTELDFKKSPYPQYKNVMEGWNLVPEYQRLWDKFIKEFDLIKENDFESYLALLKKYTSTIPSATYYSYSDISLYDHLKTTTAIANCRYLFSKVNNLTLGDDKYVYRIINGDISGIQNFIYKISAPQDAQSGMSKRLRGRSLYLTLLTEAIANKIVIDLNLDSSNILFCGGGRFIIIAPNTDKTDKVIKDIDLKVNEYFIKQFNAELYLALVSIDARGIDLDNFGKVLSKLNPLLNENKKHKFSNHLTEIFNIENNVNYELCPVCGGENPNEKFCDECESHEKLGQRATNAKYLIKYISESELPKSDFYLDFLNIGFIFNNNPEKIVNKYFDITFTIYKLNDTNFLDLVDVVENKNVSFDFMVLGNSIPNIKGKPLYFNHLAEISKGANKLGILKMDVDDLGLIFSKGFDYLGEGGTSISRISSLSFYLDLFFSGLINQIAFKFKIFPENYGHSELFEEIKLEFDDSTEVVYKAKGNLPEDFRDLGTSTIYINYSGGDDLLVVGPYDDIIEFAREFRKKFKKWTAYNDSINISAGITLISPKFPIGKAAIMADDELKRSKGCGKDKITVFNEILMWDTNSNQKGFNEIFDFSKELEKYTENKKLSKGFVYSLLNIWEKTFTKRKKNISNEEEWNDDMINRLSSRAFIPKFKYKLRTVNNQIKNEIDKKGVKFMPWIKTPVSWVSLRLR